ncbi:hypothetical protein METBIDRAFT_226803 [Metschnikowia bicuspidata var. bicuspidata NRRL YB-4993]|uniref:Uncharacterized protein n=1 Tax=Metschnikowia bicuspidata var. bicuspidata NRRL YB-4993 TaxID=869754 RepID=A0A1A0H239_9ASCO|nr:hypothetical protein METBIDRAFT_226803 [Metschnikowia bicuspidata var. bicuspidata NRRL YB-4993]OBA18020.1 hypothetical protein METBIDRAFT_226803 [Metschnikowia bicuspidata var. bicuspidata NRRL YB-4993]
MSSESTKKTIPALIGLDDDSLKDLKFCVASFCAIVIIIFNYAYIMRQWVLDPELPMSTLAFYLATLICTMIVSIGFLAKVVHPRIYCTVDGPAIAEKKNE